MTPTDKMVEAVARAMNRERFEWTTFADEAVKIIRVFLDAAERENWVMVLLEPEPAQEIFAVGDRVKITEGKFVGETGCIRRIYPGKGSNGRWPYYTQVRLDIGRISEANVTRLELLL